MDTDQTDPGSHIGALDAFGKKEKLCLESMVNVDFGAVTHVGKVLKNNEDHYRIVRLGRSLEPLMANVGKAIASGIRAFWESSIESE